jgi:FtsZ-binding cell division protein ZapB
MGEERARKRKHLFINIACSLVFYFIFSSCTSLSIRVMEEFNFSSADALMDNGQYAAALAENKKVLADGPVSLRDQALYRIALIYTHNENSLRDLLIARAYFSEIIKNYPDSILRGRSKLWIQLIDKIERSQEEIANLSTDIANFKKKNDSLRNENDLLKNENDFLKNENDLLKNENDLLKNDVEKKEKRINLLESKIFELEKQIENLKEIDLGLEQKKSKGVP